MWAEQPMWLGLSRRFWCAVGFILVGIIVALVVAGRVPNEVRAAAVCQVALLGIAAAVAAWYAEETRRMADEAFEGRKLAARPYVRLKQEVKPRKKPEDPDEPDVCVYAYNEGPHVAWEVKIQWTGDAGREDVAGELIPHEESEHWSPPGRCERAVLSCESIMGQRFERSYYKTPSGWWRPVVRRPGAS